MDSEPEATPAAGWSPRATLMAACFALLAIVLLFLFGREWIAARLDGAVPLSALKFVGIGLATLAGVWALLTETTYKDGEGRKHLTHAGYAALGIAFTSLLFAAVTFTMETFLADRAKLEARVSAERAEQRAADERRRAALEERLEKERYADRQKLVIEADGLRTRLIALTAAAESEARDRRLAGDLNRGTRDMLGRTQMALGQLERVLSPLGDAGLAIRYRVKVDGVESPILDLMRAALIKRNTDRVRPFTEGLRFDVPRPDDPAEWVEVSTGSPHFPQLMDPLFQSALPFNVVVDVLLDDTPARAGYLRQIDAGVPISSDVTFFPMGTQAIRLTPPYDVEVEQIGQAPQSTLHRSGRIASVRDLPNATLVVSVWHAAFNPQAVPERPFELKEIDIGFGGRAFHFDRSAIQVVRRPGKTFFIVPRMGNPID